MTVAFENIGFALELEVKKLMEGKPAGITIWADEGHIVNVALSRLEYDPKIPEDAQCSGHKRCRDIAEVKIERNGGEVDQKLVTIMSEFFEKQVIPAGMGAPARPLFDEVTINGHRL